MSAWSYSALDSFETCPFRHYKTKVSKEVKEPQTEALTWGNTVHKALELRVTKGAPLPDNMQIYEPIALTVYNKGRLGKIEAEQKMALTKSYQPTSWFAKDVWVRGITDFTITKGDKAFIGDWKTGKPSAGSAQLRLTAAMTMHHKPYINVVCNTFLWLKTGGVTSETFSREDIPAIWQEFAPRVARLEAAHEENKWPKKPSGLCRSWCPCTSCEHHGK